MCLSFYNNGSCYSYYGLSTPINDESDNEDFDGNRTIDPKQSLNDDNKSDGSDDESIDRDDDLNATYAPTVWSITTNGMRSTNYICPTAWFISTSSWPVQTLQLFYRLLLDDVLVEKILQFSNAYAYLENLI